MPAIFLIRRSRAVTDPVHSSDNLLAEYLGASLQTATFRLAGGLVVLALVLGLIVKIL